MTVRILCGDAVEQIRTLADESVQCVLAYCAGVIDSDGTIGIRRNTYSMRVVRDSTQPTYSEQICVKQVEPHAVDLLHSLFDGYRGMTDPTAKRGRPLHTWQVSDQKAATCLTALLPYLRIKRAQAENCLALRAVKEQSKRARVATGRGHAGGSHRPSELGGFMESRYQQAKRLNLVGAQA